MKTELVLFGKHFSMASRAQRRRLVVCFYSFFLILIALSWRASPSGYGASFITIEIAIFVAPILGGYFARLGAISEGRGLVEPFRPQKILKYPKSASVLRPSTLFHPVVDDDPELRTDERALRRRDYSHYVSHQFLAAVVSAAFILEFVNNSILGASFIGLSSGSVNRIVFGLLQIGYISSLTLPQAILLWTEPDMETEV